MTSPVDRSWRWTLGSAAAAVGLTALLGDGLLAQVQDEIPLNRRPPAAVAPAARNVVKLYKVPAERLAAIVAELQEQFAQQPAIHIGADEGTSNVVVVGPARAHQEVTRWMNAAVAAPPTIPPGGEAAPAAEPVRIGRAAHTLKNITARDAELELASIWGKSAAFGTSRGGDTTTVRIPAGNHSEVLLVVDHQRGLVTIDAPEGALASWRHVIETIDASRKAGQSQIGVVPFNRADPLKIQRAIELIHTATKNPAAIPARNLGAGANGRRQHIGQFVSMIFQEGQPAAGQPAEGQPAGGQAAGGQPEGQPPAIDVQPGDQVGEGAAGALSRIGNVQIEFVPGLDILIIRGNRRDVEMVKEIIHQIEELSVQTQPEVEIFYLQHVDGQQITDVISTIYATAFPSQGQVTLTPLVKPNAVMVIGRKEAIGPVIELIRRLDVPVAPDTQFRVFPLKFLPAVDAERTVRTFFTTRPGPETTVRTQLGTRVLAIADFRSNSLIVQASPRDLEEVAKLLEQIDVDGSDQNRATNEVRVFKLKNSLADDLVLVIQEAITGQVQGQQQQQQQQQQQPGGGQGGIGTPTPQSSAQRETRLQMLSVDPESKGIIESGILSDLRVSSDPRSNALVVVGPPATMPLIAELIRQLDAPPGGDAQVKVFTIVNGDATQLATMLQNVFGAQTGQAAGGGAAGFQSATGTGESPLVPLRFAVDTRTNSIIATGSTGDLAVVNRILIWLDVAGIRQRELKVYRLRNTSAEAVATALQDFLAQQQQLQQAQGQLISALEALEERVIVVADPVTNSLIVSATTRYLPQIDDLIEKLDHRNPMVVIQLMIVEVTLSDLDEFGAEFGLQDSLLFQRGIPTPGFNFNNLPLGNVTAGVNTENTAGQGLTSFGVGRTSGAGGVGGLVLSASSESVSLLIRALQSSQRAQILSRPQIQTMDNQPAFVQVGARVARVQGQTVTNNNVTQDVIDVNVGILLGVTPRVTPDGMVVMEIDAEKSEVGPAATGTVIGTDSFGNAIISPQILTNLAQTTITARSGQTVILGGLISHTSGESTRRVPYLGDVPVLGRLFRFDSTSVERREVLFILTPYIMDPETPEVETNYNFRETERMSWCLADVVNVHGALPVGTAGVNALSHESPLIFPDETPASSSVLTPGESLDPRLQPLPAPAPAIPAPELPPQSSRRALQPADQASGRLPRWQPAVAVPQEVQPAFQWEEQPAEPSAQNMPLPPAQAAPPPGGLTPATIAPAGYQQPAAPVYPVSQSSSIYE